MRQELQHNSERTTLKGVKESHSRSLPCTPSMGPEGKQRQESESGVSSGTAVAPGLGGLEERGDELS